MWEKEKEENEEEEEKEKEKEEEEENWKKNVEYCNRRIFWHLCFNTSLALWP